MDFLQCSALRFSQGNLNLMCMCMLWPLIGCRCAWRKFLFLTWARFKGWIMLSTGKITIQWIVLYGITTLIGEWWFILWIALCWIKRFSPNWYFSLFSSLMRLILYRFCKEKFCLGYSWELKKMHFPLMFCKMFLFIGAISATKENIVKHIYFIMKWLIIIQLNLY